MLGGYAHRIARIDLSTGQVEYFAPDPKDLEMYVGGRGLGVKYVFENGPQVDPLGPVSYTHLTLPTNREV